MSENTVFLPYIMACRQMDRQIDYVIPRAESRYPDCANFEGKTRAENTNRLGHVA